MKGFIYIISFDLPYKRLLLASARNIKEIFKLEVRISESSLKTISYAYNSERKQYHAGTILNILETYRFPYMIKLIGIVDRDIYEEGLNFIFGEALKGREYAILSIYRLYSDKEDIFIERVWKEINHELGHTFGLPHCSKEKCVMNFSRSINEVDRKTRYFCNECLKKIEKAVIS